MFKVYIIVSDARVYQRDGTWKKIERYSDIIRDSLIFESASLVKKFVDSLTATPDARVAEILIDLQESWDF